jgi:DNA-binding transcriptional regulator YdaS (Cro superfamily)
MQEKKIAVPTLPPAEHAVAVAPHTHAEAAPHTHVEAAPHTHVGSRISWAAVLAGVTVALVSQLLLGVLGVAIGASTIDPLQEANPTAGLGTGAGIWFALSGLISLFAGGWTAGRLAGIPCITDSTLHGVLTWGLSTLLTFYLLTTSVGALIGGTARVLGQGASLVGQGVAAGAPQVAEAVKGQMADQDINWDSIRQEAEEMLRQTGKPALQPEALQGKTDEAKKEAQDTAKTAAADPQAADREVKDLLNRLFGRGSETVNAADREALVNVVAARTGKSKEEADKVVARWEQTYREAREQLAKVKDQAEQKGREAGDYAARKVSQAAFWTFAAMLVGLGAASYGGRVSTPRDRTTTTTRVAAR